MRLRILLLIAGLLAPGGCSGDAAGPVRECPELLWDGAARRVPVVLIVNDAMRRDRTGAYGGPARTPVFDRFARENLRFDRATSEAPWTRPSIASLFTSLLPSRHGVGVLRDPSDAAAAERIHAVPAELVTMAEVLRDAGYRTAAFVSNPWLKRALGYGQGFESYDDRFADWALEGEEVSRAALAWLGMQAADTDYFLYLHYIDAHRPHPPLSFAELGGVVQASRDDPRRLSPRSADEVANVVTLEGGMRLAKARVAPSHALLERAYDKGIERFDRALGVFLAGLEAHASGARAVVIVTSDHGEALYARGYGNHGVGLYDDELAIPMAARLPGVRARHEGVSCPVGPIDVLPSLCRLLDLECPEALQGRDLLAPRAAGEPVERLRVAEGLSLRPRNRAIRDARYKLLWEPDGRADPKRAGGAHQLFDLREDPAERRDLLAEAERSSEVEEAFRKLDAALRALDSETLPEPGRALELDPALRERLRELGYLEETGDLPRQP